MSSNNNLSLKIQEVRTLYTQRVNQNTLTKNEKMGILNSILMKVKRGKTRIDKEERSKFTSKNTESYINYVAKTIDKSINNNSQYIYKRTEMKSMKTLEKLKYPWYIARVIKNDDGTRTIRRELISFPVVSKKGDDDRAMITINWAKDNANVYPLSKVNINSNGVKIKSQQIGKFCTPGRNEQWCQKKQVDRYNLKPSEQNWMIMKNGSSGIGVPQISKEVKKQSLSTLRKSFFDLKRSGDYGQIITCKKVNDDDSLYILNPGSEELGKKFLYNEWTSEEKRNYLENIKKSRRYAYKKCCFWSFDRLACLLALLMRVPFVYQKGKTYFFSDGSTNVTQKNVNEKALSFVLKKYGENRVFNYNSSKPPIWYLLLSIIDTAHDFGHGDRIKKGGGSSYQFKHMVMDSLRPLIEKESLEFIDINENKSFIDSVFSRIKNIEEAVSIYLIQNSKEIDINDNLFLTKLESDDMCIVFDAGNLPKKFRHLSALLSAKYADPGI